MKQPLEINSASKVGETETLGQKIRARLGRFGPEVTSIVTRSASLPEGLDWLLPQFGLTPAHDVNVSLDSLAYYLAQTGESRFIARAEFALGAKLREAQAVSSSASIAPVPEAQPTADAKIETEVIGHKETPPEAIDPSVPHINVPGYSGPERRKNNLDRRAGIQAVSKNHRFGGDRRRKN